MEMQGSIKEFSVPEIMQFLSLHEANGVLNMESGLEKVSFGFKNGKISDAAHKGERFFYTIGEYIQRRGLVTPEEYEEAKKKAHDSELSVLQVLVKEDKVEIGDMREVVTFKIQEIIDEVLTWKEGRYSFKAGDSLYSTSSIMVELEPNTLVMEGMRRIDEWPQIRAVLSDGSVPLRKLEEPEVSIELGENEEKILEKIEKGDTVNDLVKKSGLGKFQTYNSVYKLIDVGFIETTRKVKGRGKVGIDEKRIQKYRFHPGQFLKRALLIFFIIIHIFFFIKFKLPRVESLFNTVKNIVHRVDK